MRVRPRPLLLALALLALSAGAANAESPSFAAIKAQEDAQAAVGRGLWHAMVAQLKSYAVWQSENPLAAAVDAPLAETPPSLGASPLPVLWHYAGDAERIEICALLPQGPLPRTAVIAAATDGVRVVPADGECQPSSSSGFAAEGVMVSQYRARVLVSPASAISGVQPSLGTLKVGIAKESPAATVHLVNSGIDPVLTGQARVSLPFQVESSCPPLLGPGEECSLAITLPDADDAPQKLEVGRFELSVSSNPVYVLPIFGSLETSPSTVTLDLGIPL